MSITDISTQALRHIRRSGVQGEWGVVPYTDVPPQADNMDSQAPSGQYGQSSYNQQSPNAESYEIESQSSGHINPHFEGGLINNLKVRSTIATTKDYKSPECFMESGGTHNFFHTGELFVSYDPLKKQSAQFASEMSIVVRKGKLKLPINGGVIVETTHTLNL